MSLEGFFVADSSCWRRRAEPAVRETWRAAIERGQIFATPIVSMEILYSTRNTGDFADWERRLSDLREAPLDRNVASDAVAAMRDLAGQGHGAHRVPITDALIAAAAARRGVGVLHHDAHFDRLAEVLDFESVWLPERPTTR